MDVALDWKFNKKLKGLFNYQYLEFNNILVLKTPKILYIDIFLAELSYRIKRKMNIRGELQYLYTKDDKGDWIYGLVEYTFAPHYSIALIDEVNIGSAPGVHYYTVSATYTKGTHKFLLIYGRQSEGFLCAGGVCRPIPSYTGFGLSIFSNF